jgi:hypothetical protein
MAYLCTRTNEWSKASVRLVGPLPEGADPAAVHASLLGMLHDARIQAGVRWYWNRESRP